MRGPPTTRSACGPRWRRFVAGLPYPVVFLHRDEFRAAHPDAGIALPAIVRESDDGLEMLLGPAAFAAIADLPALEAALTTALAARP